MKWYHSFLLISVCLMTLSSAFADTTTNVIDNGNFDQIQNVRPKAWSIPPAQTDLISVDFPKENTRGHIAQVTLSHSGSTGAYFVQSAKVQPHSHYRLSLMARLTEGEITAAVAGGKDENKMNVRLIGQSQKRLIMFPLFWDKEWSKFHILDANEWQPLNLDFDSGELTEVTVSFGAYFTAGTYSFDDISLVKVEK